MTQRIAFQNKRKKKYPEATACQLGSLEDLRASGKGGADPNGRGSTVVATDVLWSDPVVEEGLCLNSSRGVGVIFGPDVTQASLLLGTPCLLPLMKTIVCKVLVC